MAAFSREQVLAHRALVQGLSGPDLGVLGVGLQDTPASSAALGLRARAGAEARVDAAELVLALTARGSPHLHRRTDLPLLRAALAPAGNDEVLGRFGGLGQQIIDAQVDASALTDEVAARMREVFPGDEVQRGAFGGRHPARPRGRCGVVRELRRRPRDRGAVPARHPARRDRARPA